MFVGDVVGTGSSRKSATNSILWFIGEDIPGVPNKRACGVCIGSKVAPIFFNTMEDAGALVFEAPVDKLNMGDVIEIRPYDGRILSEKGDVLSEFAFKSDVILDEVQAGGRINLIIGRGLTDKAREALKLPHSDLFRKPAQPKDSGRGYTLAQKMVGKACGVAGIRPGTYCEPKMTNGRLAGHHRPHDGGRAEGARLPQVPGAHGDAVLLPHRALSETGGRPDAP